MRARSIVLPMALVLVFALPVHQARATFVIVNTDSPGEGFNDPTAGTHPLTRVRREASAVALAAVRA